MEVKMKFDKKKYDIKCGCKKPKGEAFLGFEHDGHLCCLCKKLIYIKLKAVKTCNECGHLIEPKWKNPLGL